MKVLSVSTHCNIGGITYYIATLASALQAIGIETVVATAGGELEGELARRGIAHRRIPVATKFEFHPRVFVSGVLLARIVRAERIDVIHAHTRVSQVAAAIASRLTGVPVVTTCHGYFKKRLRRIVDTWGVKVIAISDAVYKHLEADLGVDPGRIELVYSGVDAERFARDLTDTEIREVKESLGCGQRPVVGTIGRLSPVKGQIQLIRALAILAKTRPDVFGLIIGSGGERQALEAEAAALGIAANVRFIDSTVDTRRYLAAMDVFVFPSIMEGLGIALLEAMASGRPCVASRIGGIENIISDGVTGRLAGVADPGDIAKAIGSLLADRGQAQAMGGRARALVREKFTLERMAQDVARVYEGCMKARGQA